jgi:aminobenzoyl-glutamate utilization protein A
MKKSFAFTRGARRAFGTAAGRNAPARRNLFRTCSGMEQRIRELTRELTPWLSLCRRDLHRFPETAWTEFRTASLAARLLSDLGYRLRFGREAVKPEIRELVPSGAELAAALADALAEGADPALTAHMEGGCTALWADLPLSRPDGPRIAFRFDMDANALRESASPDHRPHREGFASRRPGRMHACGHDGHTAIGLGLARLLQHLRGDLRGGVRLVFQPAEEGGAGAEPMLAAGVMDGVDFLVGLHLGVRVGHTGRIACGTRGFLASTGFDVMYTGKAAHAGLAPHEGRNALLAACSAALAMHAVPRHGGGSSRVNVGRMEAGQARNVVPPNAQLEVETRGITDEIDGFICAEALRAARAAGGMWDCECAITIRKKIPGGASNPEMSARIAEIARRMDAFTHIEREEDFGATEDFTVLLASVQRNGGRGTYIQLGTDRAAGHHNECFDFDEAALPLGLELLARIAADYLKK